VSWKEVTLGECFTIKHGFAFKGEYFAEAGQHVVLTPGNFHEAGGFRARPGKDRYYAVESPEEFMLKPGDLVIAMTEQGEGLLGSSALIPSEGSYLHNQRIGLIENLDAEKLNRRFLYHLFNTPFVRGQIRASATGGKVRHTAPKRVYAIKVRAPTVQVQGKIAEMISAYDDLIENNRRRIALLENATRMLYREWFVHFRFPGHEHVKIIDGIPEGWERRSLGSVLNLQRGFDLPVGDRIGGDIPVYGSTGIVGEHNVPKVTSPTLITGRSGSLGRVCLVDDPCWPLNTSLWVTEFKEVSIYFAYFLLSELNLAKFNGGASVPTLDRKVAHAVNVVIPTHLLATLFDEQTHVLFAQRKLLDQQNCKLAQARDLLLPRLMNGEIVL
jgi:type I restriction enzyme, S subunit